MQNEMFQIRRGYISQTHPGKEPIERKKKLKKGRWLDKLTLIKKKKKLILRPNSKPLPPTGAKMLTTGTTNVAQ